MKHSYFIDENQLEKWILAAENIRDDFGIEKALGYIIGEKFYKLAKDYRSKQETIAAINEQRKKPDYNPIKIIPGSNHKINLNEEYLNAKNKADELKEILIDFAEMIMDAFNKYEIKDYFNSNIRLGALGHVATESEHELFVEKGVVEHSIETEINDSLVLGNMMKYFDCSPDNPSRDDNG